MCNVIQSSLNKQTPPVSDHLSKTPKISQSNHYSWSLSEETAKTFLDDSFRNFPFFLPSFKRPPCAWFISMFAQCITLPGVWEYRKIPKISPEAYIFQRPFYRGLLLEGLIYGGKFAFQNRLG